jgi:non-ribosomal peptide synthetase-like protein
MHEAPGALTVDLDDAPTIEMAAVPAESSTERAFAEVLAEVMAVDRVPVDSNFFDDLGADSMVMARFCARIRKRPELPSVSIKDIYQHRTIKSLATALAGEAPASLGGHAPAPLESTLAEVLAEVMGVEQVSVDSNFFDDLGADSMVMTRFCARVRKRPELPAVSIKDIYQHPTIKTLATALAEPAPVPVERAFAEVLAEVMGMEQVSVASNFFDDLGADSMVMARFCARIRKRPELPAVSIKDIYQHPTIKTLAAGFADPAPVAVESPAATSIEVAKPAGTRQVVLCGALQLLIFLGYPYLAALVIVQGYEWISAGTGVLDIYLRSVGAGLALFLFLFTVPILAKWILIGRWKPQQQIRIWSLAYLRFWVVKTLVRRNPIVLFTGSPLFNLYLRALGAKIGRGVVMLSNHVPICTDLLSIGDGSIIRKDVFINGYQARAGFIHVGPITIGKNAVISEATIIDIDTSMGDDTQLGHASSLHSGQSVPDGQRWHGTPGRQTLSDNFLTVEPAPCGTFRKVAYATWQLLTLLLVYLPVGFGGAILLLLKVPRLSELMAEGTGAFTSWMFYGDALIVSLVLYFGSLLVGFVLVMTLPRLLNLLIRPDKVYRLYGFHYGVHRLIVRLTNAKALSNLVGDSSWIVYYLRGIGYDLGKIIQTGANFGGNVKHESPYLSSVGTGTMVADALSMMNAEFSSTSFRLSRVAIGAHNFLGNGIAYPPEGRTGDNCLLATKVMVPISGKVRENVGLLGSPAFEIPRSVERDNSFDQLKQGDGLRRRLAAKNRHNFVTILWCLFTRWFFMFMLTVLMGIAGDFYASWGAAVILLDLVLAAVLGIAYWILVERIVTGFKPLPVLFCSLYEPAMWRHERYWKVPATPLLKAFVGTPFINMILRQVGTRIGRRVFNDGCAMTERTLVTIGDDCTLNETSWIQCHSQEDGAFKSDYSTLGSNVTLGTGSLVHYGVTIGDGVVIAPDSFVMKGEEVPAGEHWGGNPAIEMRFPATLDRTPAREMPIPAALDRTPAREMPIPAALDRTPAREMPIPAALGENPTWRIPFPTLDRTPAREMPVRAVLSPNPAREMPVPAALRENRTIRIPFPAALDGIPGSEMSATAALEVRQDRDQSRSAALVGSY